MYPSARLPQTFQLVLQITPVDQIIGLQYKRILWQRYANYAARDKRLPCATLMNGFVGAGGLVLFKITSLYVGENVLSIQMALS